MYPIKHNAISMAHGLSIRGACGKETPLFPILFILVIDTLQYILHKATQEGHLSSLRDRAARLRLPLYTDDTAIFINPSKEDVNMTMEIMHHFSTVIGLCINTAKSSVAPIQ
jgi:hypothetical protein